MSAREVVVAGAVRTPIGRFGGGLVKLSAADLGTAAAAQAIARAGIPLIILLWVVFTLFAPWYYGF